MKRNKRVHQGMPGSPAMKRTVGFLMVLFGVLLFAQGISAAQGSDTPTPQAEPSPNAIDAPTDEELLAMPSAIERYLAAHALPAGAIAAANLDSSSKTVSDDTVSPGSVFVYTITVANDGGIDIPVEMTDNLPNEVTYSAHTCPPVITTACGYKNGTVSWEGTAVAGESVDITITVVMKANVEPDTVITNTAQLVSAEQNLDVSADVTAIEQVVSLMQFLPFTLFMKPDPGPITLTAGQPNGANTWSLSWTASSGASGYEIQESNSPSFDGATPIIVGPVTSHTVAKQPSPDNVFYYRARSLVDEASGPWSAVVTVVGGYRDDFDDPSTGWAVRRGTHKDDVEGFYENGRYVTQVTSRWDWLIASPLRPAPRVPYVIDFDARIISQGYVHSAGAIFGGDWSGTGCPPDVSGDDWARHGDCFNHFYNTNTIFNDTDISNVRLGLLFERIDKLEWRPNDGGSPLKRVGDIPQSVRNYRSVDPREWNHYRIEVRADSIRVYAARPGQTPEFQYEYTDTRWTTSPYFGFFTSTDIIENSTWRFEYMQVMPLDE